MPRSRLQERRARRRVRVSQAAFLSRYLELTRDLVDQELSAKIESELQLEREMRDSETLPSSLQDYLDSSSFEVSLPQSFRHPAYTEDP